MGVGDYQVSKFPCVATLEKRVFISISYSRSDPALIAFSHYYSVLSIAW